MNLSWQKTQTEAYTFTITYRRVAFPCLNYCSTTRLAMLASLVQANANLKLESCIASWSLIRCYVSNISLVVKHHPILYNSIKAWHYITKYLERNNMKSLLSLIVQNADFPAGTGSSAFSLSWDRGIRVLGDLFEDNVSKGTILWIFGSQALFIF